MDSRPVVGIERDRTLIKAAVQRITRRIFETPMRRQQRGDRTGLLAPPPLSAFKHLEPLGFGLGDEERWWIFNPMDCTPDVVWPIETGCIVEKAGETGSISLQRTVTVTLKDVRGAVTRFSPFMIRQDVGQVLDNGELGTASAIYAWLAGEWTNANAHRRYTETQYADLAIPEDHAFEPLRDRIQARLASASQQRITRRVAVFRDGLANGSNRP